MSDFLNTFLTTPDYWPLAFGLIPLLVLIGIVYYKNRKAMKIWFAPGEYGFFLPEVKLVMRGVAAVCILLALLGPYWGRTEQEVPIRGREVYVLIDVSASMNCEDIAPSRLQKVKREVKKMIGQMNGDRVGLIVFTSDAYVQCPLTSDLNAANLFLDLVGTAQFSNSGTNFREALQTALTRFQEAEDSLEVNKKLSRSIVLISDGEDFGDTYTSVVGRLKDSGITVFTVGVGTYAGAQVPEYRNGQKVGLKKAEDGSPAISQLKDETLQDIASSFNTEYLAIDDQFDNLDPVLDQIKLLSSQELDREKRLAEVNQYQIFLAIGVVLLIISMFWMPYSTKRRNGSKAE
jgi:Ca-activated chloride channel family protein